MPLFLLIYYLIRREFRALVLMAGMSLYMFQTAAILVDVYTSNVKAGMGFPECLREDAANQEK